MQNKNLVGYIRLAMLRNEQLNAMHFSDSDIENRTWLINNSELIRIEKGILSSLSHMQEDGRSALYQEVLEAQKNAEFNVYLTSLKSQASSSPQLDELTQSVKVKEATDYLQMMFQIHFPKEFPNPLVNEVLCLVEKDKDTAEDEQHTSEYKHPHLPTLGDVEQEDQEDELLTDTTKAFNGLNDTEIEDTQIKGFDTKRISDYQPKVISLFEKYQKEILASESCHSQDGDSSTPSLDNNQVQ